ncbi:hypothetical protein [Streptomyces sp. NPDC048277]|uniref:hypothetical protein n=1 Tax=Streptomyces sp. NPDC048277 TaxID=3155027 RepID=UPI0033C3DACF
MVLFATALTGQGLWLVELVGVQLCPVVPGRLEADLFVAHLDALLCELTGL